MKRIFITAIVALSLGAPAIAQDMPPQIYPQFLPLQDNTVLEEGTDVYNYWCAACHNPGKPAFVALMVLHEGSVPPDLEARTDLDADYVKYIVRNGLSAMPHFRQTQISDAQLDALANYLGKVDQ